jgi:hypothetical protein
VRMGVRGSPGPPKNQWGTLRTDNNKTDPEHFHSSLTVSSHLALNIFPFPPLDVPLDSVLWLGKQRQTVFCPEHRPGIHDRIIFIVNINVGGTDLKSIRAAVNDNNQ